MIVATTSCDFPAHRVCGEFWHGTGDARNIHSEFMLLEETAVPASKPPYSVPRDTDETFVVPTTLFTMGWISVLTDAELAFLLMALLWYDAKQPEGFALPARFRLHQVGIGPEAYEAHRLLERFGLVRVTQQAGHSSNGRVGAARPRAVAPRWAQEGRLQHGR